MASILDFKLRACGADSAIPAATRRRVRFLSWMATLLFVLYGWLLFRAGSFAQIVAMTRALMDLSAPVWAGSYLLNLVVFAAPLALVEIWQEKSRNPLAPLSLPGPARAGLQGMLLVAIVIFWEQKDVPFIYFQF